VALPALVGRDPGPNLPWWVVTLMLRVPALELRDPVPLLILMVPHDLTVHGLTRLYKYPICALGRSALMKAASESLLTKFTHSVIK
jgi:hypothetical protein